MQDERKTLDERNKMSDLERLRHSCAHVLATAILRLWPDAQFAYGPPVENGFYYDVLLTHRITPEDFPAIEAEMKKETKANNVFQKHTVTREQAIKDAQSGRLGALAERGTVSTFKLDLLNSIPEGEAISYYQNGDFIDLCAGPHVMRTGNIGAFKLTNVASAYYKGDEKNPQLQRIYGTAFKNKTEMEAYFNMIEEAKKRDHRKIGQEMGLFAMDPDFTGPGLPLWLPKGTAIVEELEKLAKETEFAAGYVRVKTPHLAREKMYKTSGHLPYYADSMFPAMEFFEGAAERDGHAKLEGEISDIQRQIESLNPGKHIHRPIGGENPDSMVEAKQKELTEQLTQLENSRAQFGSRYYLKAMNCPHHHRVFAAEPKSYRDLPLRLAEYGTCYRFEQSGELFGLMRVRSMNMNDAHIYCTEEQFADEFRAVNEMYLKYFKIFGLEKYQMRFSTHDPKRLGEKFVNEPELWKKTEDMVRKVLIESGINFVEVANEAAFYGPKIDVQVWSAIGREFTIATNQVDFAVPAKFGLTYKDRDNTNKTPLCIHRAPLGTHERFIGFLIEHYAGNFPLWLAPDQVRVITIGDDDKLVGHAKALVNELRGKMIRADADYGAEPIKAKIQNAEQSKVHTMLVLGTRELENDSVAIRLHGKGNVGTKPTSEAIANIVASITERRA
ncbi:MAG: threonine--tRNA ligase [Verrucomicrobiota bacterium]